MHDVQRLGVHLPVEECTEPRAEKEDAPVGPDEGKRIEGGAKIGARHRLVFQCVECAQRGAGPVLVEGGVGEIAAEVLGLGCRGTARRANRECAPTPIGRTVARHLRREFGAGIARSQHRQVRDDFPAQRVLDRIAGGGIGGKDTAQAIERGRGARYADEGVEVGTANAVRAGGVPCSAPQELLDLREHRVARGVHEVRVHRTAEPPELARDALLVAFPGKVAHHEVHEARGIQARGADFVPKRTPRAWSGGRRLRLGQVHHRADCGGSSSQATRAHNP